MKATGIVRRMDSLGRVVLPIELRRTLDISEKDALEIFVDGNMIVMKKYEPHCTLCGNSKELVQFKGKNFCASCIAQIKKEL